MFHAPAAVAAALTTYPTAMDVTYERLLKAKAINLFGELLVKGRMQICVYQYHSSKINRWDGSEPWEKFDPILSPGRIAFLITNNSFIKKANILLSTTNSAIASQGADVLSVPDEPLIPLHCSFLSQHSCQSWPKCCEKNRTQQRLTNKIT